MLPFIGYFRSLTCPLDKEGCDKPYCPFRHNIREDFRSNNQIGQLPFLMAPALPNCIGVSERANTPKTDPLNESFANLSIEANIPQQCVKYQSRTLKQPESVECTANKTKLVTNDSNNNNDSLTIFSCQFFNSKRRNLSFLNIDNSYSNCGSECKQSDADNGRGWNYVYSKKEKLKFNQMRGDQSDNGQFKTGSMTREYQSRQQIFKGASQVEPIKNDNQFVWRNSNQSKFRNDRQSIRYDFKTKAVTSVEEKCKHQMSQCTCENEHFIQEPQKRDQTYGTSDCYNFQTKFKSKDKYPMGHYNCRIESSQFVPKEKKYFSVTYTRTFNSSHGQMQSNLESASKFNGRSSRVYTNSKLRKWDRSNHVDAINHDLKLTQLSEPLNSHHLSEKEHLISPPKDKRSYLEVLMTNPSKEKNENYTKPLPLKRLQNLYPQSTSTSPKLVIDSSSNDNEENDSYDVEYVPPRESLSEDILKIKRILEGSESPEFEQDPNESVLNDEGVASEQNSISSAASTNDSEIDNASYSLPSGKRRLARQSTLPASHVLMRNTFYTTHQRKLRINPVSAVSLSAVAPNLKTDINNDLEISKKRRVAHAPKNLPLSQSKETCSTPKSIHPIPSESAFVSAGEISKHLRSVSYMRLVEAARVTQFDAKDDDLYAEARLLENEALKKSGVPPKISVYKSNITSRILFLRKRTKVSAEDLSKQKTEWVYNALKPFLLTMENLHREGYPILHDADNTDVTLAVANFDLSYRYNNKVTSIKMAQSYNKKQCMDCGTQYELDKHGEQPKGNDRCRYHKQRLTSALIGGARTTIHKCCNNSIPCTTREYHLPETDTYFQPFSVVMTRQEPIPETAPSVIGLDCEMVYTESGSTVARVTVVDIFGALVYDTLIMPSAAILDYCTEYSGLSKESFQKTTPKSLSQVHEELLNIIKADTIIIGHSLDSDLRALRMVHYTCVDTAITFQGHRCDIKPSLKRLAAEVLNDRIQEGESGHDSRIDAYTAVRLMKRRIGFKD